MLDFLKCHVDIVLVTTLIKTSAIKLLNILFINNYLPMSLYLRDKNLFYFQKAGRVYVYRVPKGFNLREFDLVSTKMLNNFTLLKEMDADMFYDSISSDQGVELYVEEHDPKVVAQADADAIKRFNEAELREQRDLIDKISPDKWHLYFENINLAIPHQPKL